MINGCRPKAAPSPKSAGKSANLETAPSFNSGQGKNQQPGNVVQPNFTNVAKAFGVDFTFYNDAKPGRYFLPEVMGGGAAWIDYDNDGWFDLYLVDGAELAPASDGTAKQYLNQLFRNAGGDGFVAVTNEAGATDNGYGQGCAVGDYNADGFDDLFFTNFGRSVLLRNNGDGTFDDVTASAGVGDSYWGTSTMWLDVNEDGLLDLFVANYLQVNADNYKICYYDKKPGYCGPGQYEAVADRVFLNRGDGSFDEVAKQIGIYGERGKGLAITAVDMDNDLRPEIYVANDMAPNFLFTRTGVKQESESGLPKYEERGVDAGCASSDLGMNEASMGISCADFTGDDLVDVFLTHYYSKKNTLYQNHGELTFSDISRRSRIADLSFATLGFGTVPFDYDRDGDMDIFVTNGHVLGPEHSPNEMHPQLVGNNGKGRFSDLTKQAGPYFQELWLGRGAAGGDFDNDGDMDLGVTHLERPFALLRNDTDTKRSFLGLDLRTPDRRSLAGGRVVISAGEKRWVRHLAAGGSYLCSSDPRLLIGLGDYDGPVDIEVHWPGGNVTKSTLPELNRYWLVMEDREPIAEFAK